MLVAVARTSQPNATVETNHFSSTSPDEPAPPANASRPARYTSCIGKYRRLLTQ